MKKIYTICLVLTLLISSAFMQKGAKYQTYISPDKKFSFQYALTWKYKSTPKPVVCMVHSPQENPKDPYTENVNIVTEDLPDSLITTDDYHTTLVETLRNSISEFKLISDKIVVFGNQGGYEIVYTGKSQNVKLKWLQRITVRKQVAYIASYIATPESYNKFKAEADIALNTFKFKK